MSSILTRSVDQNATAKTRARYSRIAAFYDRLETLAEIESECSIDACPEVDLREE